MSILILHGFGFEKNDWQAHMLKLALQEFDGEPTTREIRAFDHFGQPVRGTLRMSQNDDTITLKLVQHG